MENTTGNSVTEYEICNIREHDYRTGNHTQYKYIHLLCPFSTKLRECIKQDIFRSATFVWR